MATTTALIAEADRQWALLLVFDGISIAFTDHRDLVGFDLVSSEHDVRLGLQRDGLTCKLAVNLRDGQWLDSGATFPIVDFSQTGDLADIFGAVDATERELGQVPIGEGLPVHPGTDLAARTDLHDKYIGTELIGPAGERHQYPVPASFAVGGDHTITTPELDIAGAPVTAKPIVWAGRRCALYMMFRDHITYPNRSAGSSPWRPFSEARPLWFGVVADQGSVSGREWVIECEGPGALLRKPLFVGASPNPVPAKAEVEIVTSGDSREDGIYVALLLSDGLGVVESYGIRDFATFITGISVDDIRTEIRNEITACAATAGIDGTWDQIAGYHVAMDDDGAVTIAITDAGAGGGQLSLILHRRVWGMLGYNIDYQKSLYPDEEEPTAVLFVSVDQGEAPGPDYWRGIFRTGEPSYERGLDNNGATRTYRPQYDGGTTVLLAGLNEGRGQIVRLADAALGNNTSQSTVAHPGQYALPIPSLPDDPTAPIEIDGTPCDRCGFWLFAGKRRMEGSADVFDERWVGFASWVNGSAQQDGLVSGDTIIVTAWLDPKLFGYDTKGGSDSDWVALDEGDADEGGLSAVPIAMLGWDRIGADRADLVLQRLLYTTGTSTGYDAPAGDDPALDTGDNEPSGAPIELDAEVAALGLAVPEDWIALPAAWQEVYDSIGNSPILDVKVAFTAGYQAEDAIRSLMNPAGLAWHFRDGRLGIWQPHRRLTLSDATVSLTPAGARVEKQRKAGRVRLRQDHRKWAGVDAWKVQANWQPLERKTSQNFERIAPDPQVRYRPGQVSATILAHAMRNRGDGLAEVLLERSAWFARRHFEVARYPVQCVDPGLDIWPGTIAHITDPELFDPATGYGVENRIAIVTATMRSFDTDDASMLIDLLVLGDVSSSPRVNAPIGKTWGYNSATGRLYVRDDYFGIGNGWNDAAQFSEPSYVGIDAIGGQAVVECWQWDGTSWAVTLTGTVTGVSTSAGDSYLTLTSTSGTYYRDQDGWVVFRPSTVANGAWVEAIHSPIANQTGTWVDDAAASQDVYPWED